jgi:XTP/dITP diphosphohydrolase
VRITFVTSNEHKANEAAGILSGLAEVVHVALECPEIRDDSVAVVARGKAEFAFSKINCPVICDDTGLFISALHGFPGSCAAFVQKTIGNEGILKLLADVSDRSAWFETGIAYADESGSRVFVGRIEGTIVSPKGSGGFGYDPIFAIEGKTLAEMSPDEKNSVSHRSKGLHNLRSWLLTHTENEDKKSC